MSFSAELAAFRALHPTRTRAEVFMIDLNGRVRGKLVPIGALEKLGAGTMKMPASTAGLDFFSEDVLGGGLAVEIGDPDGVLDPVLGSLSAMEWTSDCAQVQVTIRTPDGGIADYDPRNVLAAVARQADQAGLTPMLALELEFFLIDPTQPEPAAQPNGIRLSNGQVYDLETGRQFQTLIDRIEKSARTLGADIEGIVTEYANGQFEINLHAASDPLAAVDQVIALRRAIRGVARAEGLDASFMAKPWGDTVGSGLHMHLSLWDQNGTNVFSGRESGSANPVMQAAIGGMLRHMPQSMLIFAPHLNSYRRFAPGWLAPVEATWSVDNRGAAVRVPSTSGQAARIEHRVAGADANPYLVAAAVLASALDGIEDDIAAPHPLSGEIRPGQGQALPVEWGMAEAAFTGSEFIENRLGARFRHVFGAMKRQERNALLARVTRVEHDLYLRRV